MEEWKFLYNLIGEPFVNSWQFMVMVLISSFLLLVISSILTHKTKKLFISSIPALLGALGLTLIIGITTLNTYEAIQNRDPSEMELGILCIIPYIFLVMAMLGWYLFHKQMQLKED